MVKRRRKPMSEEQRLQSIERLAKARELRQKNNPPQYKNVHESVLALDDDHYRSHKKVKEWIKHNREILKGERKSLRNNMKGAESRVKSTEGYIRNLEKYLRDGDYADNYYGQDQEHRTKWSCFALAYDEAGNPKRTQGVFYPDLGYRWGEEDNVNDA